MTLYRSNEETCGFLLFGRFTCHSRGTTWCTGTGVGGAGGEVMTLSVNLRSIKKNSPFTRICLR